MDPKTLDPGQTFNNTVFLRRPGLSLNTYRLDVRYEVNWGGRLYRLPSPSPYNVTFRLCWPGDITPAAFLPVDDAHGNATRWGWEGTECLRPEHVTTHGAVQHLQGPEDVWFNFQYEETNNGASWRTRSLTVVALACVCVVCVCVRGSKGVCVSVFYAPIVYRRGCSRCVLVRV